MELERNYLQESLTGRDEEMKQLKEKVQVQISADSSTKVVESSEKGSPKYSDVDSSGNVESSSDTDVSRHAASNVPHYISVISYSEKVSSILET